MLFSSFTQKRLNVSVRQHNEAAHSLISFDSGEQPLTDSADAQHFDTDAQHFDTEAQHFDTDAQHSVDGDAQEQNDGLLPSLPGTSAAGLFTEETGAKGNLFGVLFMEVGP
jgi:hypothetical protein